MAKRTEIIIGLAGRKRSGKTTAANHVMDLAKAQGLVPIRIGFADPLKAEVAKIFGPTNEEDKAILRPVYQAVGEAMKALRGRDVWTIRLQEAWNHYRNHGYNMLLVDDVRFAYEAKTIQGMGGQVWRVVKPDSDASGDLHPSETNVDLIQPDATIFNEKTLEKYLDLVANTWSKCA